MGEPIEIKSGSGRFDVQVEVGKTNSDGTMDLRLRPHPDRYDWREDEEGSRVLFDIKTGTLIPEAVFLAMAQQMGVAMYAPPSDIPDAEDFLARRKALIEAALRGEGPNEELASPSAELLAERAGEKQDVAALSVDLVNSTRLQASNPEAYGQIVPILLREIAAVTAVFGGVVINFTGDGAVVGFFGPGFNVSYDLVFDAATALVADIYSVMNPALEAVGLPSIDVRVGLDANEAEVTAVGSEDSRRQNDVLGIAVSMAAKVQGRGAPGEVWVGQTLFETLHASRQDKLELGHPGEGWDFVDRAGQSYALFRCPLVPSVPPAEG